MGLSAPVILILVSVFILLLPLFHLILIFSIMDIAEWVGEHFSQEDF
jgi:hypothetical protein